MRCYCHGRYHFRIIPPDVLAAVEAGDGLVRIEDPVSHRVFMVVEQSPEPIPISDYVAAKLDEAQEAIDRGEVGPLDIDEIKAEVRTRLAERSRSS